MSLVPLAAAVRPSKKKRVKSTSPISSSRSPSSAVSASLSRAQELAVEAVREDSSGDYGKAAECYREAIDLFRGLSRREVSPVLLESHPRVRSGLKEKIQLCSERLRTLEDYFRQRERGGGLLPSLPEESSKMKTCISSSSLSMAGSTHSLYPRCEIKRSTSIMSGASDFGLGEEIYETPKSPPLANLESELRLSLSSLSSDEGFTSTLQRRKTESDADAILVLEDTRLLPQEEPASFEERLPSDNASDSGISEQRTVISCGSSSRNKSPDSITKERLSSFSGSAYELYSEEIYSAETNQPSRYDYVPPRTFARRNKKEKELDGCFYLMACLDAFGVL